ncbi:MULTISPECIES: hypothetical protein [unclassified Nocardioides]|uniref:hypothetical protein n=1 Tax=unclassified Nocardioides TaxID=2615069 RepID=UPI00114DE8EB|nr:MULTISPECIES: hypothetical protein [unclassified Nocardioides]WGY01436.1 hypothetical protein QI633_23230 [Nocardioides sp. QY071]
MSDQQQPPAERPVVNGVVALVAVALGVGLVLALVALVGTKVLGLGGDNGDSSARSTVHQSMYLPTPVETDEATGPLVTLHTQDTDEPAAGDSGAQVPEDEPTTELTSETPAAGQISLQALATTVASGERIYFSGVYPGGEGAILFVQRFENGDWADFPASVGVTNGTFSSYIFTGVSGVNRFRVVDRDSGTVSNEISVTVG